MRLDHGLPKNTDNEVDEKKEDDDDDDRKKCTFGRAWSRSCSQEGIDIYEIE